MTDGLDQAVSELGFMGWYRVVDRASVADLFQQSGRCGVYVLSFSNGEAYVGQAVDVTRRYVQHRRVHADIEAMTFKALRRDNLGQEEGAVIRKLESKRIGLRNVVFASIPHGPSDFDMIMSAEDQSHWLTDVDYVDRADPRTEDPETRRRFTRRYQQFMQLRAANEVVSVLRAYVRRGIPVFPRGEMSFWACSCLPNKRGSTVRTYARISVYQQEVFAVHPDEGGLLFTWYLAKSPLRRAFGPFLWRMRLAFPLVGMADHTYVPGGQDQVELSIRGANNALRLMRDPNVLRSIRLFNLRLMKKGPCMFSRYHCFDLADRFYDQENDFDSSTVPLIG